MTVTKRNKNKKTALTHLLDIFKIAGSVVVQGSAVFGIFYIMYLLASIHGIFGIVFFCVVFGASSENVTFGASNKIGDFYND